MGDNTNKNKRMEHSTTLNSGHAMPLIGLGTYKAHNAIDLMLKALDLGYRALDTAWMYQNEAEVGQAIAHTDVKREDLFVATKIWPNYYGEELAKRSIDRSLKDLQVDYLDMMYLHWWSKNALETWHVLEDYHDQGIIKSISVSNFNEVMLNDLMQHARVMPSCDQIEIHPLWPEEALVRYLHKHNIQPVAYCPIARANPQVMQSDIVQSCAQKYHKTPVQVVLRWQLDRGVAVIPKTVHEARLPENLNVFDFKLTEDEIKGITSLECADGKISHPMTDENWLAKCVNTPL